jgi:phosphatidylserine decarboxylase
MHKPSAGVCLEGLPYIFFAFLVCIVFALLGWGWLSILALLAAFGILHFFRDPERVVPQERGMAVSPADGKVVAVDSVRDPVSGIERQRVCVFMNVFNVHVNRMPVAGTVQGLDYYPGKFLNASLDKASKDNERNVVSIVDEEQRQWTVVQIAGLVARRIICWAENGDKLKRGQRFGLIKFGSRVDLYLPEDYEVKIKVGAKAIAGQTVVARQKNNV